MEESEERIIVLPLEIDIYEESYELEYERNYEGSLVFNVRLPYDVLRIVFQHLNNSDLANVTMVCRSWLQAARDEICSRRPYCFMQHYKRDLNCIHKTRLKQSFDYIKETNIKPSIGFFFLPFKITAENEEKIYINHIKGRICELLPKNRKAIYIVLFSYNADHPCIKDLEYLRPNTVYALLPQIPKISMFEVTDYILKEDKYTEYMQMIEGATRQNHEMSTCLMLFCNRNGFNIALYMASLALCNDHDENNIISVCGGLVDKVQYVHSNNERFIQEESNDREPYCVALLITGPIQTWSVVVDNRYTRKETIEEKLKIFKEQVKLQINSVGFMFTSMERQLYLYQNEGEHLESTIFKRLFPEVPLVNCFGERAFGKNTNENVNKPNHCRCEKKVNNIEYPNCRYPIVFSKYCTVFMILTYTYA